IYADLLLIRLPSILNNCSDSEIFKKLICSFSYMSHSVSMAETSLSVSMSYIDMAPAEILNAVTKLVKNCSWLLKSYIKYCLKYLRIVNSAKLRDFALIQLRSIVKVYPTCLTQNEINFMFSEYFPHSKNHFMYFFCAASHAFPNLVDTAYDCRIPELLEHLGQPSYLSVTVLTVLCNLLLKRPAELNIQTPNIDFLCSTFQNFFLTIFKSNASKENKKGSYKFISFILVVQERFKNFENNNSLFFDNIRFIPLLDLYKIAIILTVIDVHRVSSRIFSYIFTNGLISTELRNYFEFLKTLTDTEVSSFSGSTILLANNSYLQSDTMRCNFQKKYAFARIQSLKIGNTLSSMLKNGGCNDSRENSLCYVSFFLGEFLREIQQLEQSWMSIYQCTYDGDLESKNLLKTYSNVFKLLSKLLSSREACFSYLKIFDDPIHPFCSKLVIKSAMNFKLQKEHTDIANEIGCKINEIFNFSTQGYFMIQTKLNCKYFQKIKQLKIIAEYSKTQPDAHQEWHYSGIRCPKITISVSSTFLFGSIKHLF
ncbi:hypothetical protein MXB_147, partial [Myxobolus squamalis]